MKKVLLVLSVLLIGCTTYQPIASVDPIYGYTTNTIDNEFELQRLLRTDFKFRYDFAQFAMRQPLTWQWSNRMSRYRFNRYNYWNPYNPMDYTQMWNDWLWGHNSWNYWGSPHRWSPFGYNWIQNGYYGNSWYWRTQMNTFAWQNRNRTNTVRVNGRRSSLRNEAVNNRRVRTNNTIRINRTNNDNRIIRTNVRNSDVRPPIRTNTPTINRPPTINRQIRTPRTTRRIVTPTVKKRGN